MRIFTAISASALLFVSMLAYAQPTTSSAIEVVKHGTRLPVDGPADNFTGIVRVTQLFPAKDPSTLSGGLVNFAPSARSAWHTHPLGQTLVVTNGTGWVQEWGGEQLAMKAGDVVRIRPGVKHWHGATATTGVSHIAIREALNAKNVQ
jgi:quercetin dioxygenase-like cupin family protein